MSDLYFNDANHHSAAFFRQIVEDSADGIVAIDSDERLVYFNRAAEQLFGYPKEKVLGQPLEVLLPPRYRAGHGASIAGFLGGGARAKYMGSRHSHITGLRADGTEIRLGASIVAITPGEGLFMVAIVRDIGQRLELQERLVQAASTDPLTGALNRRAFLAILQNEWQRTARYGSGFSLLLFDLDHFKKVNDAHGHDTGDSVLCRFAALVRASLREVDVFARWGGEEFIAALPHTPLEVAMATAERIRKTVAEQRFAAAEGAEFPVTVSVGVSSLSAKGPPLADVIKWADTALYEAKHGGRNRVMAGGAGDGG